MKPGMDLLLKLFQGRCDVAATSEPEIRIALVLAEEENVLPWAVSCLRRTGMEHNCAQLATQLQEIERYARVSAFFWRSLLKSVLSTFHDELIPVISFKGPWMAERLYGDAGLRLCADLDLLVRLADFSRAGAVLASMGFAPAGLCVECQQPWVRNGVTVELHYNFENPLTFDFDIDCAWARALPAEFDGVPTLLLAPADELLFLCLHGARHHFARLSHILDLSFAFRNLPADFASPPSARGTQSADLLALGFLLARRLDPQLAVSKHAADFGTDRNRLERLAAEIWRDRMLQDSSIPTWLQVHRLFAKLESTRWRQFLRQMLYIPILMTRLIDADYAFAVQFHLQRPWQVWLLRPLRLLFKFAKIAPFLPPSAPVASAVSGTGPAHHVCIDELQERISQ